MKKLLSLLLAAALLCSPSVAAAGDFQIVLSDQALSVDGKTAACEKYNINGENYFKLRDLAYLLNGTGSSFEVGYDAASRTVSVTTGAAYTANGSELDLSGGDKSSDAALSNMPILVNGALVSDVTAYLIGGNNYFRLRDLNEKLGFGVDYDSATRTILVTSRGTAVPASAGTDAVCYERVKLCGVTADVLTVDVTNPGVHVKAAQVDDTVGATRLFSEIAKNSGALAVITGNFMEMEGDRNYPIGSVMVNGDVRFVSNGFSSLGLTADGEIRCGRPVIRVWLKPAGVSDARQEWTALGVNLPVEWQAANYSVLYTPAYGSSVELADSGCVMTVRSGAVTAWESAGAGAIADIPADGYILWLSNTYMNEFVWHFQAPQIGQKIEKEYYLYESDSEGFTIDGVEYIISGAPRLVKDGKIETYLEPQFDQARFIGNYSSGRTAVGTTADGRLLFVSTDGATIQQMRELMLALGCMDAINLDGGASTGFYYNGKIYRTPGRELATTVQIFVD